MVIDWKAEVEKRRDDILEDLKTMLRIESVRDESIATADAPLGPGPKEALDAFLNIGKRDGFEVEEFDGMAGHIKFGDGKEDLGILAHVDVMPAGKGWDTDPFDPVIKDGKLYARGASDDKGPSMAAYYGLKIVKELGLPVKKSVRFILGTDEESSWRGMTHYFEKMTKPTIGFSPDAFFPIINGEKGNFSMLVKFDGKNGDELKLLSFDSGLRDNMVPRDAVAVVEGSDLESIAADFKQYVAENSVLSGDAEIKDGKLELSLIGKAAHAQEPRNGENAGTYLAVFLNKYTFAKDAKGYLAFAAEYLHQDSRMDNFGISYTDEVMGDLTMNAGIFTFEAGKGGEITLNFRYPRGIDDEYVFNAVKKAATKLEAVSFEKKEHAMVPHYVSPEDPLVSKLLAVYSRQTGQEAHGMVVGGGTYGRLLERGVAFGAMFPGVEDTMHQANEFIPVDDVMKAAAIYAESIYELIKD